MHAVSVLVIAMLVAMFVMVMFMFVVMLMLMLVVLFVAFDGADPCSGSGNFVEVEHPGVEYAVELNVAVIAVDDFCLWLKVVKYVSDVCQLFRTNFVGLVQQYDVAEFNLFDEQFLHGLTALEFALQAKCIDDGDHAIHPGVCHLRHGEGYRRRLAYSACFYHDVVESSAVGQTLYLLYEIHLERAAYAAVFEGYKAVILLADDSSALYELCVDVDFSYVIDYHRELDALAVEEYLVEKGGLAASEVACDQ